MEQLTSENIDQWMSHYYKNPRPDLVPSAIQALRESGHLDSDKSLESLASFFSFIFRNYPDEIEPWLSQFTNLSDEETQVVANALWYSNTKQAHDYLIKLSESANDEMKEVFLTLLTELPPEIDEIPITAPAFLDMLWAGFMATGEEKYVVRIISALPYANADDEAQRMIGEAAGWSLKSQAANHSKVLSIIKSELQNQPESAASVLREIIAEVER
jgi:hypothetical protein